MNSKVRLSEKEILDKVFKPNVKGYDANEVDDFLDLIRADYLAFASFQKESMSYIADLEGRNAKLSKQVHDLEVEFNKVKSKINGITDSDSITSENLEYIQRIKKLEEALFKKGVDATKIK